MNVPLAPGSNAVQWFAAPETARLKIVMSGAEAIVVSLGVFVLEGGSVVAELGTNVVNVLEGYETAN